MSTFTSLLEPGHVYELRVPDTKQNTVAGYFADFDALEAAAAELSGHGPAVYFTLNPVLPDLLARSVNRVKPWAKTSTADTQIVRRLYLPLDFDAVRPAGISSNDVEHKAALERAAQVSEWLTEAGWPTPVVADSGNGAHLLYRIDLPNDPESLRLVEGVLKTVAERFDDPVGATPRIILDRKVFNAARIWKAYGTMACKGDSTEDRPHRLAQILAMPDRRQIVTREQLEALATPLTPVQESDGFERLRVGGSLDLGEWLATHAPSDSLAEPKLSPDMEGGEKRTWELKECPFNAAHTDGSAFVSQLSNGALSAGCHHNSCTWDWSDLRALWAPEPTVPVEESDTSFFMYRPELKTLEPPTWLIKNYVAKGALILLAATFNTGKTFVAVDWALRLASRGLRVFYIALEGVTGMEDRVAAWEQHHGKSVDNIAFSKKGYRLDLTSQASVTDLCNRLKEAGGFDLVVIDNLGECLADENDTVAMGTATRSLNMIRDASGGAVLTLHNFGWNGTRARGHTKLLDAHDTAIYLTEDKDVKDHLKITCAKERNAPRFNKRYGRLEAVAKAKVFIEPGEGDPVVEAVQAGADTVQKFMEYMGLSALSSAQYQLNKAVEDGRLTKEKVDKAHVYKPKWIPFGGSLI